MRPLLRSLINKRGDNRKPGLTWGQELGVEGCPYAKRWVINLGVGSVRLHRWYSGDDDRAFHDHPWWFVTFVVRGGYTDVSSPNPHRVSSVGKLKPGEEPYHQRFDRLRAPAVRYRPAEHAHTVADVLPNTWTILVTGKHVRDWGFWSPDEGWVRMRAWFKRRGHHPCE